MLSRVAVVVFGRGFVFLSGFEFNWRFSFSSNKSQFSKLALVTGKCCDFCRGRFIFKYICCGKKSNNNNKNVDASFSACKTFTMFANKEKKFVEESILKNEFPSWILRSSISFDIYLGHNNRLRCCNRKVVRKFFKLLRIRVKTEIIHLWKFLIQTMY